MDDSAADAASRVQMQRMFAGLLKSMSTMPPVLTFDKPTAAEIARGRQLIREHGWLRLLRPANGERQ